VQPVFPYADRVLAEGVPGTTMPGWKTRMPEEDRRLLVRYLRTLFQPGE
jgi:mono/diheme cytochrome c family protein